MTKQTFAHPGTAIRERREAIGMSRIALAYKAEVDMRTIERVEAGQSKPRRSTLAVIEAALAEAA